MKKLLATVLAFTMAVSSVVFTYASETIDIQAQLSNSSVEVGDTFYCDFKVTDNPTGYNSMTTYLTYDPDVIRPLDCDVEDIPSDLIIYYDSRNAANSLFSYTFTNSRINFVPKSGDKDYNGKADGKKTAGEIGIVKLTNYLDKAENGLLQNYTGTGTLVRIKFEAVGSGSTDIDLQNTTGGYFLETGSNFIDVNVDGTSVRVAGGETTTETTTTTSDTTETTTKSNTNNGSSSSGSSSSGGSGSGSSNSSSNTSATTEITTQSATSTDVENTETTTNTTNTTSTISFTDVTSSSWYYAPVMKLAGLKVVNGYSDSTFKPNDNVKRADFLLMLLRGMNIDTTKAPASNFSDVATNKYYYNAVGIAKQMGIASGDGTNFNPESYITRQDMMILAKKALEIGLDTTISGNESVLDQFNDKSQISPYAVESLSAMVENGIVNGMGEGIAPKANTTRAQAVVIISNIMDKMA